MNEQVAYRQFKDRLANGLVEKYASYVEVYKNLSQCAEQNFESDISKVRRNRQKGLAFHKGRMAELKEIYKQITGKELEG